MRASVLGLRLAAVSAGVGLIATFGITRAASQTGHVGPSATVTSKAATPKVQARLATPSWLIGLRNPRQAATVLAHRGPRALWAYDPVRGRFRSLASYRPRPGQTLYSSRQNFVALHLRAAKHAAQSSSPSPGPMATNGPTGSSVTTTTAPADSSATTANVVSGQSAAPTSGLAVGISVPNLTYLSAATQAAWLANIKQLGLQWIRIEANWAAIQPDSAGTYDWTSLDQMVSSAKADGIHVLMIVDGTAPWASASGAMYAQPSSPAAFATFAGAVAARYVPQGVVDYEVWNEPNIVEFWSPAPNPEAYSQLLQDTYTAIKAVSTSTTVISGGLSPAEDDGTNIAPVTFLTDMYADGDKAYFDAVGDHPYSYPALPNTYESWSGWSQMDQTNPSIRSVMAANGDSAKQVWITEVGAPSAGPDGVGDTAQASEITEAIANAQSLSWVGGVFVYTYEDAGTDPTNDQDWFGVVDASGNPKPSYQALANAIAG